MPGMYLGIGRVLQGGGGRAELSTLLSTISHRHLLYNLLKVLFLCKCSAGRNLFSGAGGAALSLSLGH